MSLSDPVMVALLNRLPAPGTFWPLTERLAWLAAVEAAFNLIYGSGPERIFVRTVHDDAAAEQAKAETPGEPPRVRVTVPEMLVGAKDHAIDADAEFKVQPSPPAAPMVDPPKQVRLDRSAPHPRVGSKRPEGIPTTFTMVQTVLKEKPKFSMIARDVMDAIEKRWWPGLGLTFLGPNISSFITAGRLERNAAGKLALTEKGEALISADLRHKTKGEFQKPTNDAGMARLQVAPVKAIEEKHETAVVVSPAPKPERRLPQPRGPMAFKFDHNGRSTTLATAREFSIAGKLRVAMGKGHVSEAHLAETVIGSNTEAQRDLIRLTCRGMNPNLAEVGLKIEHYPGFGLIMKDLVD